MLCVSVKIVFERFVDDRLELARNGERRSSKKKTPPTKSGVGRKPP